MGVVAAPAGFTTGHEDGLVGGDETTGERSIISSEKCDNERTESSPPDLFQMTTGYWISQAIYVAAKLGIADLLIDGPQSCVELAAATGADAASLFRLMRALASVGVFSHVGTDRFALSRLAEIFRPKCVDLSGQS